MSESSADILLVYTDELTHQVIAREETDVVKEIDQLKTETNVWKVKWELGQSEILTSKNQLHQLQVEIELLKEKNDFLVDQVNKKTESLDKELITNPSLFELITETREQLIKEIAIINKKITCLKIESEEVKSLIDKKITDLKIEHEEIKSLIDKKITDLEIEHEEIKSLIDRNLSTLRLEHEGITSVIDKKISDLKMEMDEEKSVTNRKIDDLKTELTNKRNSINELKMELDIEKQTHNKLKTEFAQIKSELNRERKVRGHLLSCRKNDRRDVPYRKN